MIDDYRDLDRCAVAATSKIVEQVRPGHLDQPTPCAGWTVHDLLRHMVGNNRGFAAAVFGAAPDQALWDGLDLDADPRRVWENSANTVVTAFAAINTTTGNVAIPGYGDVAPAQAVQMHFIDYLTHGWDVAASIGVDPGLDEDLCLEVLHIAEGWPVAHSAIWGPGAPFGLPVDVPADAPASARMLGILGRSPNWPR